MRTIAIDLGTKRIGIAMSDEGGKWATPVEVIQVQDPAHAIKQIGNLAKRENARRAVVGLPLNMDDTLGPAAKQVIEWGRSLERETGVSVVFVDERLSSFDAEQKLIDRKRVGEKLTRKRKKEQLDAVAAAGFLQAFLDGNLKPIDVS